MVEDFFDGLLLTILASPLLMLQFLPRLVRFIFFYLFSNPLSDHPDFRPPLFFSPSFFGFFVFFL